MWRKSEEDRLKPASGSPTSAGPTPPASTQEAPGSVTQPAKVNHGIMIKGEISGRGDFILDGGFEGKICLPEGTFTVGSNAQVNAEIEAREIIIHGEVVGTLKAKERIRILGTARVTGDMDTRGITIEDGAILHSKVATPRPVAHAKPESTPRTKSAAVGAGGPSSPQEENSQ